MTSWRKLFLSWVPGYNSVRVRVTGHFAKTFEQTSRFNYFPTSKCNFRCHRPSIEFSLKFDSIVAGAFPVQLKSSHFVHLNILIPLRTRLRSISKVESLISAESFEAFSKESGKVYDRRDFLMNIYALRRISRWSRDVNSSRRFSFVSCLHSKRWGRRRKNSR